MRTHIAATVALAITGLTTFNTQANILDKTDVKFSGYVKADAMFSSYSDGTLAAGNIGRDFYLPSLTPVGGNEESTQFDAHIKQTRFRFTTNTNLDNNETVTAVIELDFHATPDGNERVSNSYEPRVRHAFIKYNNWLIGQTWSTFQDVRTLPETLDFIGTTDGTIFVRQAMVKYSSGGFEVSLENPETTISPFGGGARIVGDDNTLPDLAARYTFKGDWGHFAVAGLLRQLEYVDKQGSANIDTTETSAGISLTAKFMLGQDDLRLMATFGSGLGRYLALNAVNGAVLNANNELEAIDSSGISIAYRHLWNDTWRSNFTYSMFSADNDTALTGTATTKQTYSARANILFSPSKELTFGAEYAYAKRELETGADGDMSRLQFSAKYAF
ncbi:DcaP family trimeric outer membrane transporter [Aliiglaciecola sp. LCG003]|uniref:DcaP family trimeric outer membrane transporter n=1 Tax=Aliiglaciecola sp. LCG003 TaxID=3053655 RepID=UPI0025741737|nr:DcaP family trimeric outer membrane transporter [Aliiglaciecola sp. LCG003]WJG08831.1 DcaP family trimeric outer membrane transporter [Aliiglaciecola sp. LCG003]